MEKSCLKNKYLSILGDSISTFEGYSNDNLKSNSTIGNNKVYYGGVGHSGSSYITDVNNTWWKMLLDETGMKLLVNNSWSGSLTFDNNLNSCGYGIRAMNLHNDFNNINPDIVAIYMGTNDSRFNLELGKFDEIEIEKFLHNEKMPSTFIESYALMLHNIKKYYNNADIYCFTLLYFNSVSPERNDAFYDAIVKLANYFKVNIVDLYKNCDVKLNFDYFAEDEFVHPNPNGMKKICECFKNELLKKYSI